MFPIQRHAWIVVSSALSLASLVSCGSFGWAQGDATSQSSPAALAIYSDAANLQNAREFDLAIEQWQRLLREHANEPLAQRARYYLGVCFLQTKQFDKAAAELRNLLDDPSFPYIQQTYLNLGFAHYSKAIAGHDDAFGPAITAFETLVKNYPNGKLNDQAVFHCGEALYHQGKLDQAARRYARLVNDFPQSNLRADGLYALGVTYQELDKHRLAGNAFDKFSEEFSGHALANEVRLRKAETVLALGDAKRAESLFGQLADVEDFDSADHAIYRQAHCASLQDNFEQAATLYAQLVNQHPNSPYASESAMAAGRAYYRAAKFDSAKAWFEDILKTDTQNRAEAAHWICRMLLKQGKAEEAMKLAEAASREATANDFSVDLKMDLADALYAIPSRRAESLEHYLALANKHPEDHLAPQALYNAAFGALEQQRFDEAITLATKFTKAYAEDPLLPDARYVLAECSLLRGNHARAASEFELLGKQFPNHGDWSAWHLRLATATHLLKNYRETIAVLDDQFLQSLSSPQALAEARFLLGVSFRQLEQFQDALEHLTLSVKASDDWQRADEVMLSLGQVQRALGKNDAAIDTFRRLVGTFPESSFADRAVYEMAESKFAQREYAAAAKDYSAVFQRWPDSRVAPYAIYGLGWALYHQHDYRHAEESLTRLLTSFSDHALRGKSHYLRAICRQQLGQFGLCLEDIDHYLQSRPSRDEIADALYLKGVCEVSLKRFTDAIETFKNVLRRSPDYGQRDKVLYELGWAYQEAGMIEESVKSCRQLVTDHSDSPLASEAWYHIGENLYAAQQFEKALAAYQRTIDGKPTGELREKSLYKTGWANFKLDRFGAALAAFQAQEELTDSDTLVGDAVFMQGECQFQQKNYDGAFADFQRARQQESLSKQAAIITLLHGAQAASQIKQWQSAVDWLIELANTYPESGFHSEAKYEMAMALQHMGRNEEAAGHYETVARQSRDALGARARFMLGELYFADKDFDNAIRQFRLLTYGYGGDAAPAAVKSWQAKGALEAGRCAAILAGEATEPEQRSAHLANARKYLRRVLQKHPDSPEVGAASEQLKKIGN